MDEERKALETHGTWELVEPPIGANIVGCRWVYALKRDAAGNIVRYKARLVAQRFSQIPGVDYFDTYAPVAKMASIQTMLVLGARYNYEIHQVDVKNVYLNGRFENDEVVYMKMPPGLDMTKDKKLALWLLKPIYGLKQSGNYWYCKLKHEFSERLGLIRLEVDQAVFVARGRDGHMVAVVHVDDLTLLTSTLDLMKHMKDVLRKAFKITDMGEINWILGFSVKWDREKCTISLSQETYIHSIVK
jgi:hypothetical protein